MGSQCRKYWDLATHLSRGNPGSMKMKEQKVISDLQPKLNKSRRHRHGTKQKLHNWNPMVPASRPLVPDWTAGNAQMEPFIFHVPWNLHSTAGEQSTNSRTEVILEFIPWLITMQLNNIQKTISIFLDQNSKTESLTLNPLQHLAKNLYTTGTYLNLRLHC